MLKQRPDSGREEPWIKVIVLFVPLDEAIEVTAAIICIRRPQLPPHYEPTSRR